MLWPRYSLTAVPIVQKRERHYETRLLLAAFISRLSYNLPVKAIPERVQFYLIAFGYASILTFWALITFQRHLVELQDPAAASASSGMWAAGEGMEELYLVVTVYLLWPIFFNLVARLNK